MVKKYRKFIVDLVFSTMLTVLVLIAGLFGSIYADLIKSSFPLTYFSSIHPLYLPWIFWILVIVSAGLFFIHQKSADSKHDEEQDKLLQGVDTVEQLIKTLPPKQFLNDYAELFDEVFSEYKSFISNKNQKEAMELSIRRVLRIIAVLAQNYDDELMEVEYGANIMFYIPLSNVCNAEKTMIQERIKFLGRKTHFDDLKGVLDLQLHLSTVASSSDAQPDRNLFPLALPLPKFKQHESSPYALPGAPQAFFAQKPQYYSSREEILEWSLEKGFIEDKVIQEMSKYFKDPHQQRINSFISIPLIHPDHQDNEDPFAILNIHKSNEGLLRKNTEAIIQFAILLRPIAKILIELLAIYLHETLDVNTGIQRKP